MTAQIDFKSIWTFIKKTVLSKRGIAICIALACAMFAYNVLTHRVIPMAYGANGAEPVGADPADLMATLVSVGTAVITFVASNYLGVKPEIIQAVIAFEKDKTNVDNQRRLGAAVLGYIVGIAKQHPDSSGGFVMMLLNTLIKNIEEPQTKEVLKIAATAMAANQFKPEKV